MRRIQWQKGIHPDSEKLRYDVFTLEQGFAEEEDVDEIDSWADNLVIYEDDVAIATARLFPEGNGVFHVGRLCVRAAYRGQSLGSEALRLCKERAISLGATKLCLGAQFDKADFYIKNGYHIADPNTFDDGGYPHYHMEMDL